MLRAKDVLSKAVDWLYTARMSEGYNIAVVGATGAVGEMLLVLLAERKFPVAKMFLVASERSAGETRLFAGKQHTVSAVDEFDFSQVDYAFFSAGAAVSAEYAPVAAAAGAVVIDNTSHFRREADIPLVIPEVNPHALVGYRQRNIIANPNCSTIQMLVALKPIYDAVGIMRINVATYQAVSGAGQSAIEELASQSVQLMGGEQVSAEVFSEQIAFNVIPQIDVIQENGYTREEMKMVWETQKILEDDNVLVNPTAVRVPVFYGHSEAIHIETREVITVDQVKNLLSHAPGVVLAEEGLHPTPMSHAIGHDDVFVGRIRADISHPEGLNLWVVADNVRKGAATNAIQIAELLIQQNFELH